MCATNPTPMSRACDAMNGSPLTSVTSPSDIPRPGARAGSTTASGRYLRRASGSQCASATWKQPLSPSCRSPPVKTQPRPKRPGQLCFRLTMMTHGCGGSGKRPWTRGSTQLAGNGDARTLLGVLPANHWGVMKGPWLVLWMRMRRFFAGATQVH